MDKKKNKTTECNLIVLLHHDSKNLFFDTMYDQFISLTDTKKLIENINTENLESFLYETARFFYGCGKDEYVHD